jgi:hypothetical protein
MIQIIAHRGYWLKSCEKNTLISFKRAFENGFGIETDFRDFNRELVISHDIPTEYAIKISEFISLCKAYSESAPIALNIKSNGLHRLVQDLIIQAEFINYFVFDLAVPDMLNYFEFNIIFVQCYLLSNLLIILNQFFF